MSFWPVFGLLLVAAQLTFGAYLIVVGKYEFRWSGYLATSIVAGLFPLVVTASLFSLSGHGLGAILEIGVKAGTFATIAWFTVLALRPNLMFVRARRLDRLVRR